MGFSKGFDSGAFQRGKYTVILDFYFLYGNCQFVPVWLVSLWSWWNGIISRPFPFRKWALNKMPIPRNFVLVLPSVASHLQPVPWVFNFSIYQLLVPSYHTDDRTELSELTDFPITSVNHNSAENISEGLWWNVYMWNHSPQSGTWTHVPDSNPVKTHSLLTEITHLISGLNETQVLDVLSQKEFSERQSDR